eukprot:TRINITY_DN84802_c0_g1_i1.p1 TRINITY_DN84802_c0_g1~~TRINITY_DN84802_c0_g1_i1.p1  ORF type:complete len:110 (+),score=2.97 TRINITY_DN84802_c0_g1_i1:50-379(+)
MENTILGLDLGTNSIGWAVIETDANQKPVRILGMGSRVIPLSANERDEFQKGQAISKNQDRTRMRTQRKGYFRRALRKKCPEGTTERTIDVSYAYTYGPSGQRTLETAQ